MRAVVLLFEVHARPLGLVARCQEGLARSVRHSQMVRQWAAARARKGAATANSQRLCSQAQLNFEGSTQQYLIRRR